MHIYTQWRDTHFSKRSGERLSQLQRRDDKGERQLVEHILLPALGSLAYCHPEYEYVLSNGRIVYMDVALIQPPLFINFELDGYGPHLARISRDQFAAERRRDALLKLDDWHVIRIAFDDTLDPRATTDWIRTIRALLHKFGHLAPPTPSAFTPAELALLRTTLRAPENKIRFKDAIKVMGCCAPKARKVLRSLVLRNIFLIEGPGNARIHSYKLNTNHPEVRKIVR